MSIGHLAVLLAVSLAMGLVLKRLNVPAALLIGGLSVSAVAHGTAIVPGVLDPTIALPFFAVMGTLIGTRFSGVTLAQLRAALGAGAVVATVVGEVMASASVALVEPPAHAGGAARQGAPHGPVVGGGELVRVSAGVRGPVLAQHVCEAQRHGGSALACR